MSGDQEIMLDLYNALQKILMFTQNMSKEEFINDEKTQSSVLYQFVIIGEAVNHLSEAFKARYPQVPFNEMRGLRNRVVHEYRRIDSDIIWETIQSDITLVLNIINSLKN